jgi:hypothetical protein
MKLPACAQKFEKRKKEKRTDGELWELMTSPALILCWIR